MRMKKKTFSQMRDKSNDNDSFQSHQSTHSSHLRFGLVWLNKRNQNYSFVGWTKKCYIRKRTFFFCSVMIWFQCTDSIELLDLNMEYCWNYTRTRIWWWWLCVHLYGFTQRENVKWGKEREKGECRQREWR